MNRNRDTRNTRNTRSASTRMARIVAGAGAAIATLGVAGPAFAETPPAPGPGVEISDAPECEIFSPAAFTYYVEQQGDTAVVMVGYQDNANTCDTEIDLILYKLPTSDAAWNDPGSEKVFQGGYDIKVIEAEPNVHQWIAFPADECHEVHLTVDGNLYQDDRFTTPNCGDLPLTDGDPGEPDPEHPQDLTDREPGDEPGDGDGGLPETGSTSLSLVLLAAGLTGAGGAALAASRRRVLI